VKAVLLEAHGGPEQLRPGEVPTPACGAGQVRVRVEACALNHLDLWVRRGLPRHKITLPHILGADVAGRVDAVGEGVAGVRAGDRVVLNPGLSCGRCRECLAGRDNFCDRYRLLGEDCWGGYAEYVVVPEANVAPCPPGLSVEEAAAIPLTFLTAWQMLVELVRVRPGDTVLVLAAASGVGVASVQIARLLGARVIATASTAAKLSMARSLGADEVFNYVELDLAAETRRLTDGRGADVVVEHVGADTWQKSIRAARRGGCIVTCGATSGYDVRTDLRHVFFRQLRILGSTMGSKSALFTILDHVKAGRLRSVVDMVFPLDQAVEAHRRLEGRQTSGKVILRVERT
jgi:NADPH:quinone reductase-like Zn-dependent oxidoreductase